MRTLNQMDLDAYSAAHRDEWNRLAALGAKRRFSGAEADELIDHYQSGATALSTIATTAGSTAEGDRLSLWLSRARLRFTGASSNVMQQLPRFFVLQLPAALYGIRWLSLGVTLATIIVAVLYAWWAIGDPRVLAALLPEADRQRLADEDFVNYYSEYSGSSFTTLVWTNNAWIAGQAIAGGIIGVYTPYVLFSNAQNIGLTAAIMAEYDKLDVFFAYISPHGQLELYAIFVAGAAGLAIFWSWVSPGSKSRGQALADAGRATFTIVIGLILALLLSGVIEGFVTRQDWPWPIKTGIGTVALAIFLVYQWVVGRRAARAGETGDLVEFEAGAKRLSAG